jgi:hypothetical protein
MKTANYNFLAYFLKVDLCDINAVYASVSPHLLTFKCLNQSS